MLLEWQKRVYLKKFSTTIQEGTETNTVVANTVKMERQKPNLYRKEEEVSNIVSLSIVTVTNTCVYRSYSSWNRVLQRQTDAERETKQTYF